MRRRALFSLAAAGLAGCVGGPATETDTRTDSPTEPPTEPPTDSSPSTEPPGTPPDVGVPPADSDCPAGDDAARVVCVPETNPDSVPMALTADARSAALPATCTFTLDNGSDATFTTNPYSWSLWKRVDGAWHHVVPDVMPMPAMLLEPGGSYDWELSAEHEQPPNPEGRYFSWDSSGTVGGLGGGEYAFTVDGWFEGSSHEAKTVFGVLLQFDAPELELEPTAAVTGSSRDSDTVTVQGEGNDSEDARKAEFVLERVAEASDSRTLIPEQAVHDYRLRNTLPYFERGVETVRYVATNATWPAFGVQEPYRISYDGETFSVTATELGTETETG